MPTDETPPSSPRRRPLLWPGLTVVGLSLAVFAPVLRHDFVNWDDKIAIQHNARLTPPTAESLKHYWTELDAHDEFYVPMNYSTWWVLAHAAQTRDPASGKVSLKPWPFH